MPTVKRNVLKTPPFPFELTALIKKTDIVKTDKLLGTQIFLQISKE